MMFYKSINFGTKGKMINIFGKLDLRDHNTVIGNPEKKTMLRSIRDEGKKVKANCTGSCAATTDFGIESS